MKTMDQMFLDAYHDMRVASTMWNERKSAGFVLERARIAKQRIEEIIERLEIHCGD